MNRRNVQSSDIASIGYDSQKQILEVEFHQGSIYRYYDVPEIVYNGLMSATSHGQYLNLYIIKAGYRNTKVL